MLLFLASFVLYVGGVTYLIPALWRAENWSVLLEISGKLFFSNEVVLESSCFFMPFTKWSIPSIGSLGMRTFLVVLSCIVLVVVMKEFTIVCLLFFSAEANCLNMIYSQEE